MRFGRYIYIVLTATFIASLICGCYFTNPVETGTTAPTTPFESSDTKPSLTDTIITTSTQTTLSDSQIAAGNMLETLSETIRSGELPDFCSGVLPEFPRVENYFTLDAKVSGNLSVNGTSEELAALLQDYALSVSASGNLSSLSATLGFEFSGFKAFDLDVISDASDVYLTLKNIYPNTIKLTPIDYGHMPGTVYGESTGFAEGVKSLLGIAFSERLSTLFRNALASSLELIELYELEISQDVSKFTVTIPRETFTRVIMRFGELLVSDSNALEAIDSAYENMVFTMTENEEAQKPSDMIRTIAGALANADSSVVTGDAVIETETSEGILSRVSIQFELFKNVFEYIYFNAEEQENAESYIYMCGTVPSFGGFMFYFGSLKSENMSSINTLNVEYYDAQGGTTMLQLLLNSDKDEDGLSKTDAEIMAYIKGNSISCDLALEWKLSEDGRRITLTLNVDELLVTNDAEEILASGNISTMFDYGENGEFVLILPSENIIEYSSFIADHNEMTRFFEGVLDNKYLYTIAKLLWGQ